MALYICRILLLFIITFVRAIPCRVDLFGKCRNFETITFDDILEAHGIDKDMNAAVMIKASIVTQLWVTPG